ncbi:MAG: hypothetical protein U0324_29820 [Polyangiales bacterium]
MDVFVARARRDFAAPLEAHLARCYPRECAWMGEGAAAFVEATAAQARGCGLEAQRDVCHYLNLVMLLGCRFEDDPLLPWAADALFDEALGAPGDRVRALCDRAIEHHERVAGVDEGLLRAAAARLPTLFEAAPADTLDAGALGALLGRLQPEREAPDAAPLRGLALRAREVAAAHAMAGGRGEALVAMLMALLGHGLAEDGRLPWARATLDAPRSDGDARAAGLLAAAARYFDDVTAPRGGR